MRKFLPILLPILLWGLAATAFADERRYSVPVGDSLSLGPANAPLTLIEFIDYQ